MSSAAEAAIAKGDLAAPLAAGVKQISRDQTITFTKYVKVVLPLDGYVFWVRADLLSQSAILNAGLVNGPQLNQPQSVVSPSATITISGSLHYATQASQDEAETYSVNRIVFTSLDSVEIFNTINPQTLYIGEFQGLKFSWSARGNFYRQADLYHYQGDAVYPDMQTQVVDDPSQLNTRDVIVSNSLPIWLSMSGARPTIANPFQCPVALYPSFVVPDDIAPPFGAVHILPESTEAIAAAPSFGSTMSHDQLVKERVRVTLWGTRNFSALDFLDFVNQFSLNTDYIGIMNQPIPRDEKRVQSELSTIAQKKTIDFVVSYYQSTTRNIARQLITRAIPIFFPN